VIATKSRKTKPVPHQELLDAAESLAAPIDVEQLIAEGAIRKAGGWYEIIDGSRLPEHVWHRIKAIKRGNRVKFRKANKRIGKYLGSLPPSAP